MADANAATGANGAAAGTEGAVGAPALTPPAVVTPVVAPKVEGTPATPAVAAEPKRVRLSDGDEIPADADVIEMSRTALAARLSRASAKDLKKKFGTDDVDQIAKDLKELATLREEKEATRVAALSDLQKATERAERAERERDAAHSQAKEAHAQRTFERDDAKLTRIAEKVIDPDYVDSELVKFAEHLSSTYDRKALKRMTDEQLAKVAGDFFKGRVEKKPKLAKDYETSQEVAVKAKLKAEAKAKGLTSKVTNGSSTNGRKDANGTDDADLPLGKQSYAKIKEQGYSYR